MYFINHCRLPSLSCKTDLEFVSERGGPHCQLQSQSCRDIAPPINSLSELRQPKTLIIRWYFVSRIKVIFGSLPVLPFMTDETETEEAV